MSPLILGPGSVVQTQDNWDLEENADLKEESVICFLMIMIFSSVHEFITAEVKAILSWGMLDCSYSPQLSWKNRMSFDVTD